MELKTTADCKLILEGVPQSGKEILVFNYKEIIVIEREDLELYTHIMEKDGLYQYYILDLPEEGGPSDLLDYINDYKLDPIKEVFSICKLRNCLLQKEKERICDFLKNNCSNSDVYCNKNNTSKNLSDFLLISVFLLENLICRGNYQEALRILDGITGCNNICGSEKTTKDCGCNG